MGVSEGCCLLLQGLEWAVRGLFCGSSDSFWQIQSLSILFALFPGWLQLGCPGRLNFFPRKEAEDFQKEPSIWGQIFPHYTSASQNLGWQEKVGHFIPRIMDSFILENPYKIIESNH